MSGFNLKTLQSQSWHSLAFFLCSSSPVCDVTSWMVLPPISSSTSLKTTQRRCRLCLQACRQQISAPEGPHILWFQQCFSSCCFACNLQSPEVIQNSEPGDRPGHGYSSHTLVGHDLNLCCMRLHSPVLFFSDYTLEPFFDRIFYH